MAAPAAKQAKCHQAVVGVGAVDAQFLPVAGVLFNLGKDLYRSRGQGVGIVHIEPAVNKGVEQVGDIDIDRFVSTSATTGTSSPSANGCGRC